MKEHGCHALLLAVGLLLAGPALAAPDRSDVQIRFWEARLSRDAEDHIAPAKLGLAFAQKARESGDPDYYRRAEAALRKSLERLPDNYQAQSALAWIYVAQHRFQEARTLAERCIRRQPNDAVNYGTLGDALVELGEYAAAEKAIERMMELEPDLPAYARMAHQRELRGDRGGALRLMRRALAAVGAGVGSPTPALSPADRHNRAWCWTQLGDLHFRGGDLKAAGRAYRTALQEWPGHCPALVGQARVATARRQLAEAERLLVRAIAAIPRPETVAALGDVYALAGKKAQARRQYELVVQIEQINAAAGAADPRRMALFYADHDRDLGPALALAQKEARTRRDIYTCDALAWALYKNRRFEDAWEQAQAALRLGTADAMLLYHAGMIARRLPGKQDEARQLLKRALALNPYFDPLQAPIARATLARLAEPVAQRRTRKGRGS